MPCLMRPTFSRVCVAQEPNICSSCHKLPACVMLWPCGHIAMCVPSSVICIASHPQLCACAYPAEASMETQPSDVKLAFHKAAYTVW